MGAPVGEALGDGLAAVTGAAVGVGEGDALRNGVGLSVRVGVAVGLGVGAVSAKAPAGARLKPRVVARTPANSPQLTALPKSLQLFRPGRVPGSRFDPNTPASAGPFSPDLNSLAGQPAAPPWAGLVGPDFALFSQICHHMPDSTFLGSASGHLRGPKVCYPA